MMTISDTKRYVIVIAAVVLMMSLIYLYPALFGNSGLAILNNQNNYENINILSTVTVNVQKSTQFFGGGGPSWSPPPVSTPVSYPQEEEPDNTDTDSPSEPVQQEDSISDLGQIQPVSEGMLLAGWRSSMYGYQQEQPPSYWVDVAKDISSKFPGTTPGGIWIVGETDGNGPGTILYMPSSGSYQNIKFEGGDVSEQYLNAFDSAGLKVILQVEPMDADVNMLIDIVMNQYKHHPSVIGFGVDNEWYGTCRDGCEATASEVTSWYNHLHSINPNYILMIKHYEESKLPTGIPTDILVVCDDEENGNLNTLLSEHEAMANRFSNNPFGAQYGYPSDENIWSSMQDPVKQLGDAIQERVGKPISLFWVDFSIQQLYH
jgi:hypothetical protein